MLFIYAGAIHSQGMTRMIIATVTKQRYEIFGPEYISMFVTLALMSIGQVNLSIKLGVLIALVLYSHYVVVCIQQIKGFLNINCLTITKPKE